MFLSIPVKRCELPTPDAFFVNHPLHGIVLIADHRVSDEVIRVCIDIVQVRGDLHPDLIRDQNIYGDPAELRAADRKVQAWADRVDTAS